MIHLTLASGVMGPTLAAASTPDTDFCLLDYAQCPTRDICILVDMGSGCTNDDWCLVDKD
ncbi:MAG: hypothetical protein FJY74_09450 [Candidatus Eisenbacteria bacterium]|nr:hypothetical protein [Candidatus Eisenbacteria bacterium]